MSEHRRQSSLSIKPFLSKSIKSNPFLNVFIISSEKIANAPPHTSLMEDLFLEEVFFFEDFLDAFSSGGEGGGASSAGGGASSSCSFFFFFFSPIAATIGECVPPATDRKSPH